MVLFGDTLDYHNQGMLLALKGSRPGMLLNMLPCPGQPPTKNCVARNVSSKAEKSWLRQHTAVCICLDKAERPKSTGSSDHEKLVLSAQRDHTPSHLPEKEFCLVVFRGGCITSCIITLP